MRIGLLFLSPFLRKRTHTRLRALRGGGQTTFEPTKAGLLAGREAEGAAIRRRTNVPFPFVP